MPTSFDLGEHLPAVVPASNPTPNPPPTPTPEPTRPPELTPSRYPRILLNQRGHPSAFIHTPGENPTPVQIDDSGIIWAGDSIVAHYTDTGLIRPAMEMPAEATPAVIDLISEALLLSSTYVYNDLIHVATEAEGIHRLRPLQTFPAFDAHMSASIAFVKIKTTKDNITFTVVPLDGRIALSIFASANLKDRLPNILVQNPVALPYHPNNDRSVVRWNPPGYNPDNLTYTNNEAQMEPLPPLKRMCHHRFMLRWHRELTGTFLWNTPEDYRAYLAQTLSGVVTELLTPTPVNGVPGERAMMPASLIESGSTQGASGKSILTKLAALGPYGIVKGKVPPSKEEVQAFIVTALDRGERCIFLDEAKDVIADSLLTAISDEGGGRIKGQSREVYGDLHVMLAAANPTYSSMMSRRILSCKIKTRQDYLTHRFRRPITKYNLPSFRPMMLTLARVMIDRWADMGCPRAEANPQWQEYSEVVGGILEANGIANPLNSKIAAVSYAASDSDHIDAQFPAFLGSLTSGEITMDTNSEDGNPPPLEGSHSVAALMTVAQQAGFYSGIKPDLVGNRLFVKSLSTWLGVRDGEFGDPICGYQITKKRKNTGNHIIFKKVIDDSPASTTN